MIFYPVDARTVEGRKEWLQLRLGKATASCFHKILTPKRLELSEQRKPYMRELLEEWMTGEEIDRPVTEWQQRGIEEEDAAIASYEAVRGDTEPGGFFTDDAGMIGASPDRLVGEDGDLEIKTGALRTAMAYELGHEEIAADHQLQIQGRLWLHKRKWVDVFAYGVHSSGQRLIPDPVRVYPEKKIIDAIANHVPRFVDEMLQAREKLERRHGPFWRTGTQPPPDVRDFVTEDDFDAFLRRR